MLVLLAGVLVVVVVAGVLFVVSAGKPLYRPGMVRQAKNLRAPLAPPPQTAGANLWLVEPNVKLFFFEEGSGSQVLVLHGGPGYPYLPHHLVCISWRRSIALSITTSAAAATQRGQWIGYPTRASIATCSTSIGPSA
jgi:hypothetical protein